MSESLLSRCKRGCPEALEQLCAVRSGQVYRWAVLLGLGSADAQDAAQDVLTIALRRIERCRSDASLTSWLYQITRRVVANLRRRWWRRCVDLRADEPAFAHDDPAARDQELETRRCLARLTQTERELLILVDVEGLTREEAAEMLRLPSGTVAGRLKRARLAFQRHWHRAERGATTRSTFAWRKT